VTTDASTDVTHADGVDPEADDTTASAPLARTVATPGPRTSARRLVPWILVVLAVAVAVVSTWRWQELAGLERTREDVAAATSRFVTSLTSWDAAEGMAATRDELRTRGTEAFARDVDELFGSTEDLRGLEELGARSEGEVRDVYVQRLDGARAETLAVVVQRVTTSQVTDPEVHLRYAAVTLERVEGGWLVDDLELLVDADPAGGAAAPTAEPEPEDGA
jgi:hypothetical protein